MTTRVAPLVPSVILDGSGQEPYAQSEAKKDLLTAAVGDATTNMNMHAALCALLCAGMARSISTHTTTSLVHLTLQLFFSGSFLTTKITRMIHFALR